MIEDVFKLKKSSNLKIKIDKARNKYSSLFIYRYQLSTSSVENLVFCVKFSQNRYKSLKIILLRLFFLFSVKATVIPPTKSK